MNSSFDRQNAALPQRFPAHQVTRVMVLSADHARSALHAMDHALGGCAAEVCGLTLKPVGEIVEAILRLRGLDDTAAEAMAGRLAAATGVHSVRVEHQWGL